MRKNLSYSAYYKLGFFWKTIFSEKHETPRKIMCFEPYSSTSSTLALIFDFPPVGSMRSLLQTRQFTLEDAFPNVICSFLHFGHLTFINFDVGSLINSMVSHEFYFFCSPSFFLHALLVAVLALVP